MISPSTIQQIQSRIDIIEIISTFIKLKKRGTNFLGLCPFHNEKTPSFTVSPAKEIYKCFGCGRSGNTISFLMEHEKYSYVEALKWLAGKYNVQVEESEVSPEQQLLQQTAESLYVINSFAQKFLSDALFNSEEGQDIGLSYLKERGFREEIIRKFQIGYNPEARDSFAKNAIANQFNLELLQKSGLVTVRDEKPVDNYRGRIIFPVHNQTGKIAGFGARQIRNNERGPKYINTPENDIYLKSKILYGSYFARTAIDKADECFLVEGYTDVVSLHQAGIENVVASGGTSLTPDQLRLVKKYTGNITIIYDGDKAGIKAALRGLDLALEESLNVRLVLIPDGEDPDSYLNKIGPTAFIDFISKNKKDFILFQLEIALQDAGDDSIRKSQVVSQVAETISKINKAEDFTKQQDYIRKSASLLKIDEAGLTVLVNKYIREKYQKDDRQQVARDSQQPVDSLSTGDTTAPDQDVLDLLNRDELNERAIVRALLDFGTKEWEPGLSCAAYIFRELIEEDMIDNQQLMKIINSYKAWYDAGIAPSAKNFLYHDDQLMSTLVVSLIEFPYEVSKNWEKNYEMKVPTREDTYKEEVFSTVNYLKLRKIKRMIAENQLDLEKKHSAEEQLPLLQTHKHLKELEIQLTRQMGTVIFQ
ncbi:MAG: DNA primase [Chitinophagaceae bacterium]